MVQILSKYKKNEEQWYKIASLLETMYEYLGGANSRKNFFASSMPVKIDLLREVEEFWKTDHIFMSRSMRGKFNKELEFYRHKEEN